MFDSIILSCINILSKCYTSTYYKCFFKHQFDNKTTSCEIFVKHLNKYLMKC